ncbi:MAG: Coenzyme F420 hydrogenase/dehydrogenase, beta subunit C-terminal domain [Oscillospiraceae bacterium]
MTYGKTLEERTNGPVISSFVGRSGNREYLKNSVSGGIATELINGLLELGKYDFAIGVKNRKFNQNNKMQVYTLEDFDAELQKSVYTMPSFSDVIFYINNNPQKKGIIIASGCVISALKKYISSKKNLLQDNYLFIGLFCDCSLNKNIENYFYNYSGKHLKSNPVGFDFRTKDKQSYWPGNIAIKFNDFNVIIPREERYKLVKYFKNMRCLFCLDHMNVNSDISLGDNYTNLHSDKLGSNSIVVRTDKGKEALGLISDRVKLYPLEYSRIVDSQKVSNKYKNLYFSKIFYNKTKIDINKNIVCQDVSEYRKEYKLMLKNINSGKNYCRFPGLYELFFILKGDSNIKTRINTHKEIQKMGENNDSN